MISGDLGIKTNIEEESKYLKKTNCVIVLSHFLSRKINCMRKELLYCKCGR